jgi:YD repeat-containing protein
MSQFNRLSPLQTGRRYRPLPWQLRFMTWVVIASQLYCPFAGQIAAQEIPVAPPQGIVPSFPSAVLTPTNVVVNRTPPKVEPPDKELKFSATPTDQEIFQARVFSEPIVSMGRSSSLEENRELAAALIAFGHRSNPEDASAIEDFLAKYPESSKRGSLLLNVATLYRRTGQFTKALAAWEEAWKASKNQSDLKARAVAEAAVGELAQFTVTLGRTKPLRELLAQLEGRDIRGSATERIAQARESLWDMENNPSQAFKCGPFSLYRMRHHLKLPNPVHQLILDETSSTNGTSLAQMWELSERMEMNLQMAKRQPGAAVLYPSMVYWKLGHFSALVRELNGRYLVEDTTFADQVSMTRETLDTEAMGYFLVPAGDLPQGWSSVRLEEAKNIWGRMTPTTRDGRAVKDNDRKFPCDNKHATGMARYAVHGMQVNLNIVDVPLSYAPPRGPVVEMRATYNHREGNQPAVFNFSNLGAKWTFDWLSYISDNVVATGSPSNMFAAVAVSPPVQYPSGGGGVSYSVGMAGPPPEGGDIMLQLDAQSRTRLVLKTNGTYRRVHTDGLQEIFSLSDTTSTNSTRRTFLTAIIDPHGNSISNTFDANFRIVSVTDALGQVNTIEYGSTNATNDLFYKITKVTDPFGRYCTFQYNTNGQLTNITDVIGMPSSFTYTSGDFIDSMRTPYGTTSFTNYQYGLNRWIEITEPDGEKRRIEYRNSAPGIAAKEANHLVPTGLLATNLNRDLDTRNTFYWDKKAMRAAPGDYTKAYLVHWLYSATSWYVISAIPESEKAALENRVWFNYPGQAEARMAGTTASPSKIARVLDDGTTQMQEFEYESTFGQVTKSVDAAGRTFSFERGDANPDSSVSGEVIKRVDRGDGPGSDRVAAFRYNTNQAPIFATNVSGQVTAFGYNAFGQLTSMTNALSEVTTLNYDTNGYLTNITGAISGAVANFTYDSYGRARTVTESEGYTATFDYDALDRLTKVTYPDGTFEQAVYDKLDAILQKDRRGHWSRTIYNAVRQPTAIQDALGRVTHLDWCGCGGLESIIDPMGRVTTWMRDIQGRVTSKVYSDTTETTYAYEPATSRLRAWRRWWMASARMFTAIIR